MCWNCVAEQGGADAEWTPEVARVAGLIRTLYETHPTGGPLHIATDDFNLEDSSLDFCQGELERGNYADVGYLAQSILDGLRPMSEGERALACWGEPVEPMGT